MNARTHATSDFIYKIGPDISCVSVNHLHLHVQVFLLAFTQQDQCKYLSNTLTWLCVYVNVSRRVSVNPKVTMFWGLLSPQTLLSGVSVK